MGAWPTDMKSTQREFDDLSREKLGLKLKMARRAKGLTLKELALRCGCSESLLSKVENGHVLPSIKITHRLVHNLDTNITWLFDESIPQNEPVLRQGQRPVITLDYYPGDHAGIRIERIIPYREGHILQSNIHHIEPGAKSGEAFVHEGEETGYIVVGEVILQLDDVTYHLRQGDAFCFPSDIPHSYSNPGTCTASILWTCTPPTF